ncbi:MAG: SDR family oxidoreductase [Nisaea sp.]|uniref:SDR family NAD(P)-dependent oxidoreductase n=1 Tax=Nisaea sp. TaxID=2024842 RepID=UPI001B2F7997|nr:SDR family oxidoreductase [Nisaea sp.]MBO6560644.1 SDR family oxidoreductase [Nisaea sp.]
MSEFTGKSVLITGASSGLGRQLAVDFAREGAKVAINYAASEQGARETLAAVEDTGGTGLLCRADIAFKDQVEAMVAKVAGAFGGIDILINSAGLSIDQPLLEMTEEAFDRVLAVNLKGPFLLAQAVGRLMVAAGHGRIVNISATTAIMARAGNANYAASKGGLNLLTQSMALELGPAVNVNGVALGMVDSEIVRKLFTADEIRQSEESVPLKRLTTYEETSKFVRMLASDAAGFMTGQTVPFDGGRVMR